MYYAQIDSDDIVFAVTQTAGEIISPDMIVINYYDDSLLGKQYNKATGEFADQPPE